MRDRKQKILLLGCNSYSGSNDEMIVVSCGWDKISPSINLRDYDTILINLLELSEEKRSTINWQIFGEIVSLVVARDVLQNQGKIILVGDPRFQYPVANEDGRDKKGTKNVDFLNWTGLDCSWDASSGDTIEFFDSYDNKEFVEYVRKLKRWEYSLSKCKVNMTAMEKCFRLSYLESQGYEVDRSLKHVVQNRYRHELLFEVSIGVFGASYSGRECKLPWGPIVFLPPIDTSVDETIQIVLRDMCGFESALPEPAWISSYKAPGQGEIDEDIVRIHGEIDALNERLNVAKAERVKRRSCLKLLYEREFELEPAVRDILRALGGHVEDPTEKNKEDGWLSVDVDGVTYEGVLEIKSTRKECFGEDGRKQLVDWIDRGITLRQKKYKGIFIGNSAVDKSLNERPVPFSDSWKKAAELGGLCALTTVDLYIIYLLHARGSLDVDSFWKHLFSTNGILSSRQYYEALAPKEKS